MPKSADRRTRSPRRRRSARPRTTTPVSAKSPLRRAISSTTNPQRPSHTGKWTAVRTSSSLERGGPGAVEEVGGRDTAGDAGTGDLELGVERERDRGQLGGGVGVGDRTADGAAVADLEVTDHREGLGERAARPRRPRSSCSTDALTGHRLDRERAVLALDAAQLVDPVEVDDVREAGEPHAPATARGSARRRAPWRRRRARRATTRRRPPSRGRGIRTVAGFIGDSDNRQTAGSAEPSAGREPRTPHATSGQARRAGEGRYCRPMESTDE